MKILFVTNAPPFPPTDGARLIVANLARALAAEHTLHLVSFAKKGETGADMREWFAEARLVPLPNVNKAIKWLKSLADPLPMWVRAYDSDAMRETLRQVTREHELDVVHLDTANMTQYADAVAPLPKIFAPHDSLTLFLANKRHSGRTFASRLAARLEYPKMRRFEAANFPLAERVCVVSPGEQSYLNQLSPAIDARVIPNGVDTDYFHPRNGMEQPASIGFLGMMNYAPNRRAAIYFAREVMPLVWQALPQAVFTIIGRDPTRRVLALAEDARIRVTGTVEDVRPHVGAQQVMVAPMREAGGIKNKLLEAMALGKAIVTTPEGMDGVDARPDQDLIVAASSDALAAACIRLMGDASLRAQLGRNARAWALEHTWSHTARQYIELYREAIHAAAGR